VDKGNALDFTFIDQNSAKASYSGTLLTITIYK